MRLSRRRFRNGRSPAASCRCWTAGAEEEAARLEYSSAVICTSGSDAAPSGMTIYIRQFNDQ